EPVRAKHMPPRTPERFVALCLEARAREHQLGDAAQMKREMLEPLQKRRRLNHEQRVMIQRARWPHEGPYSQEPVRRAKSQARVEPLGLRGVRNEEHDVGQRA